MFHIIGHFAEGAIEVMEARGPRLALKAAVAMARRGRERITIGRRGAGPKVSAAAFAERHGLVVTELEAELDQEGSAGRPPSSAAIDDISAPASADIPHRISRPHK